MSSSVEAQAKSKSQSAQRKSKLSQRLVVVFDSGTSMLGFHTLLDKLLSRIPGLSSEDLIKRLTIKIKTVAFTKILSRLIEKKTGLKKINCITKKTNYC